MGSRPIDRSPLGQSRQVAGGSEGPLRTLHSFLLGDLVLHQEQAGGKEPAGAPVAAEGNRKDGGASGGHDLPAFDNLTTLKTRSDEGHALPLPESLQPPDPIDRRAAGPAQDRSADLFPGPDDPDDSPPSRKYPCVSILLFMTLTHLNWARWSRCCRV